MDAAEITRDTHPQHSEAASRATKVEQLAEFCRQYWGHSYDFDGQGPEGADELDRFAGFLEQQLPVFWASTLPPVAHALGFVGNRTPISDATKAQLISLFRVRANARRIPAENMFDGLD